MKSARLINLFLPALIFGTVSVAGIAQRPPSSADLDRQWKEALKVFPPRKGAIELELRSLIPSAEEPESDALFWEPRGIACDADNNIYVTDRKGACLLKFDGRGRFLRKRGHKGQGPGDFLNPYCLRIIQETVVVGDTGRRDVQVFSRDLELIRSFKVRKAYYNLVPDEQGRFYGTPLRGSRDESLVDVLDREGRMLFSFGQPRFGNAQDWQVSNFVYLDIADNGDALLAFQHWPVVCRYSASGELKAVHKIVHKGMKEAERFNLGRLTMPHNDRYRQAIFGLRAVGEGFYLLHNYPITEVLGFDLAGNPVCDFWAVRKRDCLAWDFFIQPESGSSPVRILFLESTESRIEVFTPKDRPEAHTI
jgi:hypothetical protein